MVYVKRPKIAVFCACVIVFSIFLMSQNIYLEPTLDAQIDKSARYVGAQQPHAAGFTGKGIRIAVIDTGVDYNHPDLRGFGYDGKVIGGFDFVRNNNDPIDTNGHGTEVAGIIAASGNMVGIAPDAKILAYRVSDTGVSVSSELIVSAIKRASEDGADVINISLGVNRTNERIEDAIDEAVKKGIVVVVAAGNSGPDPMSIGSPGKNPHAITVGATYNNITSSLVATLQVDGMRFQVLPMVGIQPVSQSIEAEMIFGKHGRVEDLMDIDADGKILLVERGSDRKDELVYFSEKEKNSANAGAKAVIVFNNEPGIFLGDLRNEAEGPEYSPRIPAVSMSKEDGQQIKSMLENKTVGTISMFYHPDFVSFFSSRGPVSPFYIKPNLVAPGVFVNATSINSGYNLTSGTSFAAPHVSGAIALLLQKNPGLSPQEVKSIIMTTADPIVDTFETSFPYEVSGAGRLNVTRAFDAGMIILPDHVVFDLSSFSKSKSHTFTIKPLHQEMPDIKVAYSFERQIVDFSHSIEDDLLTVTAVLTDDTPSTHQGSIMLFDGRTTYQIPVIIRVADASIDVTNDDGRLGFAVSYAQTWSYAMITVFDSNARQVGNISITPTRQDSLLIYKPGIYWIQADLKTHNDTVSVYNTIEVESPSQRHLFDFVSVGLPQQQTLIIISVVAAIITIGVIIRVR